VSIGNREEERKKISRNLFELIGDVIKDVGEIRVQIAGIEKRIGPQITEGDLPVTYVARENINCGDIVTVRPAVISDALFLSDNGYIGYSMQETRIVERRGKPW